MHTLVADDKKCQNTAEVQQSHLNTSVSLFNQKIVLVGVIEVLFFKEWGRILMHISLAKTVLLSISRMNPPLREQNFQNICGFWPWLDTGGYWWAPLVSGTGGRHQLALDNGRHHRVSGSSGGQQWVLVGTGHTLGTTVQWAAGGSGHHQAPGISNMHH